VEVFDAEKFTAAIAGQRICEGLAKAPFFQPLTIAELEALTYERLIIRLCNRYQHVLAYHIADYLNSPYEPIYNHWAHCHVLSEQPPDAIIAKLKNCPGSLDFTKLALAAVELRPHDQADVNRALAAQILALNPLKSRNVPLWIRWGLWDKALQDSIESNDVSLLLHTLDLVKGEPTLHNSLVDLLAKNPIALQIWIRVYSGDPEIEGRRLGTRDLLTTAGLTRDIFTRDLGAYLEATKRGGTPDQAALEQAKRSLKPVKTEFGPVVDRITGVNSLCQKLGVPVTLTPYQIFDAALEKGYSDIKKAASLLQLSSDEVRFRQLEVGALTKDQKRQAALLRAAVAKAKEDELLDMAFRLNELGRRGLLKGFLNIIRSHSTAAWIRGILEQAKIPIG
jgi:hypothetical protein